MNRVSIAVVDDDAADGDITEGMVRRYFAERDAAEPQEGHPFELSRFADGMSLLDACDAPGARPFDLIILDIEMPGIDGMRTAHLLRERDSRAALLFTTRMAQYATVGYDVDAIGYLVKPLTYPGFALRMRKALAVIGERRGVTITIQSDSHMLVLDSNDIRYVEVNGHSVLYHTADGVRRDWGTLKAVEARLAPYHFVRSNRYCLVNLDYVTALDDDVVTVDGDRLIVSRSRRKPLMQALSRYHRMG